MAIRRNKSREEINIMIENITELTEMSTRKRLNATKINNKQKICCVMCLLFCVIYLSVLNIFYCVTPTTIPQQKWIDTCQYDFYMRIGRELFIAKDFINVNLQDKINQFYSMHHFTEAKHHELLSTIRKERLLMKDLRRLQRSDSAAEVGRLVLYPISEYSVARPIAAIATKIAELIGSRRK